MAVSTRCGDESYLLNLNQEKAYLLADALRDNAVLRDVYDVLRAILPTQEILTLADIKQGEWFVSLNPMRYPHPRLRTKDGYIRLDPGEIRTVNSDSSIIFGDSFVIITAAEAHGRAKKYGLLWPF